MKRFGLMLMVLGWMHLGMATSAAQPVIIAHRGLFKTYPENTLPAFEACLKLGIGLEFDVRTTRDGALVVFHDATVDRTTSGGSGEIRDLTLAEVQALDAGVWFGPKFKGTPVPTFAAVLDAVTRFQSKVPLAVNVKGVDAQGEIEMVQALKSRGLLAQSFFFDQDEASSQRLKALDPQVRIGKNVGRNRVAEELQKGLVDVFLIGFVPSKEESKMLRNAGKSLIVNKGGKRENDDRPEAWEEFLRSDIDGMLVDYAEEFQQYLKSLPSQKKP